MSFCLNNLLRGGLALVGDCGICWGRVFYNRAIIVIRRDLMPGSRYSRSQIFYISGGVLRERGACGYYCFFSSLSSLWIVQTDRPWRRLKITSPQLAPSFLHHVATGTGIVISSPTYYFYIIYIAYKLSSHIISVSKDETIPLYNYSMEQFYGIIPPTSTFISTRDISFLPPQPCQSSYRGMGIPKGSVVIDVISQGTSVNTSVWCQSSLDCRCPSFSCFSLTHGESHAYHLISVLFKGEEQEKRWIYFKSYMTPVRIRMDLHKHFPSSLYVLLYWGGYVIAGVVFGFLLTWTGGSSGKR